jgi:hypothetical protein
MNKHGITAPASDVDETDVADLKIVEELGATTPTPQ